MGPSARHRFATPLAPPALDLVDADGSEHRKAERDHVPDARERIAGKPRQGVQRVEQRPTHEHGDREHGDQHSPRVPNRVALSTIGAPTSERADEHPGEGHDHHQRADGRHPLEWIEPDVPRAPVGHTERPLVEEPPGTDATERGRLVGTSREHVVVPELEGERHRADGAQEKTEPDRSAERRSLTNPLPECRPPPEHEPVVDRHPDHPPQRRDHERMNEHRGEALEPQRQHRPRQRHDPAGRDPLGETIGAPQHNREEQRDGVARLERDRRPTEHVRDRAEDARTHAQLHTAQEQVAEQLGDGRGQQDAHGEADGEARDAADELTDDREHRVGGEHRVRTQ